MFTGYSLLTRWKGYSPADDTAEPLHHAAEHHKEKVVAYIKKPENEELLHYVTCNPMGLFSEKLQEEMRVFYAARK